MAEKTPFGFSICWEILFRSVVSQETREDLQVTYTSSMPASRKTTITPVGVVGKVLLILELLDRSAGLQLKDIARRTGLNKSTAHRFLKHLEGEGNLFREDSAAYMIGPRLVRFGTGVSYQALLSRISRPVLEQLWSTTGETVNLATLLAAMSAEQRELLLPTLHFENTTPKSITSVARLRKDLTQIARLGYALDDEEAVLGARCIGASILDANGKIAGGISISGPTARINKTNIASIAQTVKLAAHDISTRLGFPKNG